MMSWFCKENFFIVCSLPTLLDINSFFKYYLGSNIYNFLKLCEIDIQLLIILADMNGFLLHGIFQFYSNIFIWDG
jgi:hypothetical protein